MGGVGGSMEVTSPNDPRFLSPPSDRPLDSDDPVACAEAAAKAAVLGMGPSVQTPLAAAAMQGAVQAAVKVGFDVRHVIRHVIRHI